MRASLEQVLRRGVEVRLHTSQQKEFTHESAVALQCTAGCHTNPTFAVCWQCGFDVVCMPRLFSLRVLLWQTLFTPFFAAAPVKSLRNEFSGTGLYSWECKRLWNKSSVLVSDNAATKKPSQQVLRQKRLPLMPSLWNKSSGKGVMRASLEQVLQRGGKVRFHTVKQKCNAGCHSHPRLALCWQCGI